ncbi:DUF6879 family protein [Nocardia sp. 004]|uniref:DUF6879 family protein n=1 Tax=Nocardia sp. 004 TaxID=3385978 RepID=UPI0039A3B9B8
MELRQNNPWPDLFREVKQSAFHIEVRDTYAVPSESEPLRRFLAGEPSLNNSEEFWNSWGSLVKETKDRGVVVGRIRVVTVPLSDYQRWLLTETGDNIEAGEDIRYLPRHLAGDVPQDDFWLFDDEVVGFNLIDADGKPAGASVTTDPGIVSHCQRVKEQLWSLATPFSEFQP